jgi:ATP-dependent DNA ligase
MSTLTSTISNRTTDISPVDALWVLIQGQSKAVRKALIKRLLEEDQSTKAQQAMLKDSLSRAFEELHTGNVKHNARNLFAK